MQPASTLPTTKKFSLAGLLWKLKVFWRKLMLREFIAASPDFAGPVSFRWVLFEALFGVVCSIFMALCSLMPASTAYTTRVIS